MLSLLLWRGWKLRISKGQPALCEKGAFFLGVSENNSSREISQAFVGAFPSWFGRFFDNFHHGDTRIECFDGSNIIRARTMESPNRHFLSIIRELCHGYL